MEQPILATLLAATLLLAGRVAGAADAPPDVLEPSATTFKAEFRGINAGTITMSLRQLDQGRYAYESRSNARGLARLVVPNEVIESSTFVLRDGVVVPLAYTLDDGSSNTSRDTTLEFDWEASVARGRHEDQPVEIAVPAGMQDRMSVQVLVMRLLAAGEEPGRIAFIDRDEIKQYVYTREGTAVVRTPLGEVDTVIYSSTREGSSRVSRIWYAPSLGYLPVRGEQLRNGKVETLLTLLDVRRQ